MSEYTPTTDEVLRCYRLPLTSDQGQREDESFAEFLSRRSIEAALQQIADRDAAQRWLAEVERAAAEKAWLEGHAAGRDYQADGWNSDAHDPQLDNPYRLNEGEKQVMKETCSFCEQQVDSTSIGSDGKTKACADCMGEGEKQ